MGHFLMPSTKLAGTLCSQDIIKRELANLEAPAFYLFAKNVPYADVDLSPPLGYDPEKVRLLLDAAGWTQAAGASVRSKAGQPLVRAFAHAGACMHAEDANTGAHARMQRWRSHTV